MATGVLQTDVTAVLEGWVLLRQYRLLFEMKLVMKVIQEDNEDQPRRRHHVPLWIRVCPVCCRFANVSLVTGLLSRQDSQCEHNSATGE